MLTKIICSLSLAVVLVFGPGSNSFAASGDFLVDQTAFCVSDPGENRSNPACPKDKIVTTSIKLSDLPFSNDRYGKAHRTIYFWGAINASEKVTYKSLQQEVQIKFSRVGPCYPGTTLEDIRKLKEGHPTLGERIRSGEVKRTAKNLAESKYTEAALTALGLVPAGKVAVGIVKGLKTVVVAVKILPDGKHIARNRFDFRYAECPGTMFAARLYDIRGMPLPGTNEAVLIEITE
jgi:hypothetical protein